MANYNTLKAAIQQVIKANGNNEITGDLLQQSLLAMVNSLGAGYQFVGGATTVTNPGTPDNNVFYLATEKGTYTNFGGIVVGDEIALLAWNGAWSKTSMGVTGSPNAVLFTPQELTDEQKAQARANIGAIIPWRVTIEPSDDTPYVAIQLSGGGGCILAIDSVGDNSFHGILNISDVHDITAASFVGGGGIDTDENVVIGYDDDDPPRLMVAFKTFGDQSIVLTCLAGTPPALAFDVDVNVVLDPTDSIPWAELGTGGPSATVIDTTGKNYLVFDWGTQNRGCSLLVTLKTSNGSRNRSLIIDMDVYGDYVVKVSDLDGAVELLGNTDFVYDNGTGVGYLTISNDVIGATPRLLSGTLPTISAESSAPEYYDPARVPVAPYGGGSNVFWATYGTTTAGEIGNALSAGKVPLVVASDGVVFQLSSEDSTKYAFNSVVSVTSHYVQLTKATSEWARFTFGLQKTSDRVNTIVGYESNTSFYTSPKAVADYVDGIVGNIETLLAAI